MWSQQTVRLLFAGSEYSPSTSAICRKCSRSFATTIPARAGHNKWSKTKHIKAVTDKKKMFERTAFTKLIAMYSRMYGENVKFNPQLANAISAAAKASIPKHLIEGAVARGQGKSTSGAQLEPVTLEILLPPDIAIIVDAETDNKIRTLSDLKHLAKNNGAVAGATAFYFTRRGKAVFKANEGSPTLSEMLDAAIEFDGLEDVEELPDSSIVAWTQPSMLMAITEAFTNGFSLEVLDSDIVWAPNEDTKVDIDSATIAESLDLLFSGMKEYPEVKTISANVRKGTVDESAWDKISRHLNE